MLSEINFVPLNEIFIKVYSFMISMRIKNYVQKQMSQEIRDLFLAIYPNDPSKAEKMDFDEKKSKTHVCTKVAVIDNKIVGQANIFLMKDKTDMANLGYHVHPNFHKRSIGEKISKAVIKEAKNKGIKILLVRTDASNIGSIKLAKKLGFKEPTNEFLETNKDIIAHKNIKKMVCLILYL